MKIKTFSGFANVLELDSESDQDQVWTKLQKSVLVQDLIVSKIEISEGYCKSIKLVCQQVNLYFFYNAGRNRLAKRMGMNSSWMEAGAIISVLVDKICFYTHIGQCRLVSSLEFLYEMWLSLFKQNQSTHH